jgi:precorrin-6B methylase 2
MNITCPFSKYIIKELGWNKKSKVLDVGAGVGNVMIQVVIMCSCVCKGVEKKKQRCLMFQKLYHCYDTSRTEWTTVSKLNALSSRRKSCYINCPN